MSICQVGPLERSQQLILRHIKQLPDEIIDLKDGLQRVSFSDVSAVLSQPVFDESMRDGYVISLAVGHNKKAEKYKLVDEIPAGKPYAQTLTPGTACRIMTGGCVPEGAVRVVPCEDCVEQDGEVVVAEHFLKSTKIYIKNKGSEIEQGHRLLAAGVRLQPMHLALLSSSGIDSVVVTARPSVGFFCTGDELINSSGGLKKGQKISSNSFLLEGLLTSFGACTRNLGIIQDNIQGLQDLFIKIKTGELDLAISSGGMGPGKYDLVKEAFIASGGEPFFTTLNMRPGKSVLFGILGKTLFLGLPGPPHAVQTLLNVLVGPVLLAMQGMKERLPQKVRAHLQHKIKVKRNDLLRLKDGVLVLEGGRCSVRFAERLEVPNCSILLQSGQSHYSEGELIDVYRI